METEYLSGMKTRTSKMLYSTTVWTTSLTQTTTPLDLIVAIKTVYSTKLNYKKGLLNLYRKLLAVLLLTTQTPYLKKIKPIVNLSVSSVKSKLRMSRLKRILPLVRLISSKQPIIL
jgi:hypothetical protein